MSAIYFEPTSILSFSEDQIQSLKYKAANAPLKRARYCLHFSENDPVQEMIIAFHKNSYIRPHRHINKTESFHVIEGKGVVFFFNDDGKVINYLVLDSIETLIYRLSEPLWHTIVPVSEFFIIHEVTSGPFHKNDSSYATWAPEDNDKSKKQLFISRLLSLVS